MFTVFHFTAQGENVQDVDPLCDTCGQFVKGHPLVKAGLIPAELAEIFVPIIGKTGTEKKTRIVTTARVLTGKSNKTIFYYYKQKETFHIAAKLKTIVSNLIIMSIAYYFILIRR